MPLNSFVITAAGSFLANGSAPGVFGVNPISSASEAQGLNGNIAIGETVLVNGVTVSMGSANQTVDAIVTITNQSWYQDLLDTLTEMNGAVTPLTANMQAAWNQMSSSVSNNVFLDTTGSYCPSVSQFLNSVSSGAYKTALGQAVTYAAQAIGGTGISANIIVGNPKTIGTIFNSAQSYVTTTNNYISGAKNSTDFLANTFINLDNTITGGISGVSNWFDGLASDIDALGATVNWSDLANIGSPGLLMSNMITASGTLGPMYNKLKTITVTERTAQVLGYIPVPGVGSLTLGALGIDLNTIALQGANLPPYVQKQIYEKLVELTNDEVAQVKSILGNTQLSVVHGQDLLDPSKLFSSSFITLTTPVKTITVTFKAIYVDLSGAVNPELNFLGSNLKGIIPDNLAVANDAVGRSFAQIKGISETTSQQLAGAISNLENLKDLPLLQNQTSYIDPLVSLWWNNTYNQVYDIVLGTGNQATLTICDVLGFIAGYNSSQPLVDNATLLGQLTTAGAFTEFTRSGGVYQVVQEYCQGSYGPTQVTPGNWYITVPAGYFSEGTYGPYASSAVAWENFWINELIPAIVQQNIDIYNNYELAQTVYVNDVTWQEQIGREYLNRQRIDLDPTVLVDSDFSATNFAESLPQYGLDTSFGGSVMWIERIVNGSTLGGQAVIAAMRDGRNSARINSAGIVQDSSVNTIGAETPGVIVPATYSKSEANSLIIRS